MWKSAPLSLPAVPQLQLLSASVCHFGVPGDWRHNGVPSRTPHCSGMLRIAFWCWKCIQIHRQRLCFTCFSFSFKYTDLRLSSTSLNVYVFRVTDLKGCVEIFAAMKTSNHKKTDRSFKSYHHKFFHHKFFLLYIDLTYNVVEWREKISPSSKFASSH